MKKISKVLAAVFCAVLVLGLVACGDKPTPTQNAASGTPSPTQDAGPRKNDIYIGTWWAHHYASADTSVEDSPDWFTAQDGENDSEATKEANKIRRDEMTARFEHVKKVEEKYGLKYYWNNLTYTGVVDSINTSILAGAPDCDVYQISAAFGIPAQFNGLCVDLKKILPADHDIFTTQTVAKYLDFGDGKACVFMPCGNMVNNHRLGYNKQLLEACGCEDPDELWEKGEWTWDKFREMCKKITQDTDGDGSIDQYGFCAWDADQLEQFMLANGTNIAATPKENLSSKEMNEVLTFLYDLHNVDKVCYPVTSDMDSNAVRTMYRQGNIGFFWIDCWVQTQGGDDYDWNHKFANPEIDFDVVYTHWPVGPSGNPATDAKLNLLTDAAGELFMIPAGVQDPLTVFNLIYDSWNWYNGDTTKRDNPVSLDWWINVSSAKPELAQKNFQRQMEAANARTIDFWNSMNVEFNLWELLDGTVDPSTWQATYKQAFQDALDNIFGK